MPEPTEESITFTVRDAEDTDVQPLAIEAACLRPQGALDLPDLLDRVRTAEEERFLRCLPGTALRGNCTSACSAKTAQAIIISA